MSNEKTAPTIRNLSLPKLIVELPDGKEVHHHLAKEEITIGRDPTNVISIADSYISKFHAKLVLTKTSMTLVDLASANKTYVNDHPIKEAPVRFGDKIRFATVPCRLEAPEGKKPAASAAPPARVVPPRAVTPAQAQQPTLDSPVPAPAAPPRPAPPPPAPAPSPARAAQPAGRSAPPPVAEDPMKRLLRVGGLLILVSLALAIMLRVLLVPSDSGEADADEADDSRPVASVDAAVEPPAPPDTSSSPAPPPPAPAPAPAAGGQNADYYFDEGLAHLDTGRLREARQSFERALELDANHTRARTRLALLEEEIEKKLERHFDNARQAFQFLRYEEAIAEWEMFLILAPESDSRYQEAQQGIQQAEAKLR